MLILERLAGRWTLYIGEHAHAKTRPSLKCQSKESSFWSEPACTYSVWVHNDQKREWLCMIDDKPEILPWQTPTFGVDYSCSYILLIGFEPLLRPHCIFSPSFPSSLRYNLNKLVSWKRDRDSEREREREREGRGGGLSLLLVLHQNSKINRATFEPLKKKKRVMNIAWKKFWRHIRKSAACYGKSTVIFGRNNETARKKSDRPWLMWKRNLNKTIFALFYSWSSRHIGEVTKTFAWNNILHFDIKAGRFVLEVKRDLT